MLCTKDSAESTLCFVCNNISSCLLSRDLFVKTVTAVTEILNTWKSNLWSVTRIRYLITGKFCNYGVFQGNSEGAVMFAFIFGDDSFF
jgi:hypothetical protein